MRKIIYLFIFVLCMASIGLGQGTSPGRAKTKSKNVVKKKPIKKKIDPKIAEAEEAWTPFWIDFKEIIKNEDRNKLYKTMPNDFEYGFGIYRQNNVTEEFESVNKLFNRSNQQWEGLKRITSGGVQTIEKGKEIMCFGKAKTISKVSPNNWNNIANGESENSEYLLFEFRGSRWFFIAYNFCETE